MADAPVVTVQDGRLQGRTVTAVTGKSYYSFQGIPYAKPPLGSLRFKDPQPAEPWDDIRDATAEGNVSAQIDPLIHKEFIGDENCLFLNVYTPNLDGQFLPVMVYIHGGGFKFGSGNTSLYSADYLVERDVVLVTLNYRCGPLGFLCLNTPEVPGNAGLKDIALALRWVKDNIHNFGGNSGNITVFGESAGGVASTLVTASPLTKDLVSKAIVQSGTALNSWAVQRNPLENAIKLARTLGFTSDSLDEILEFLTTTPVRDIVAASVKMHPPTMFFEKGIIIFAPVVEREFPGVKSFITESFLDLLTSGRCAQVPVMIGSTRLEFSFERTSDDLQTFIPEEFRLERNSEEAIAIADRIKRTYFKSGHIGAENLEEYFELLSDKLVNIDTHRYVKYLVNVSTKPVFLYKFDYVGELNVSKKLLTSLGLKRAAHMDLIGYLFRNVLQQDVEPTPQDVKMRERVVRLWTNFAKSGNPTPDENHFLTVTWLPVTKDNLYYLNLGSELSLETNPDKEKMTFWDNLYNKYFKIWQQPKVNIDEVSDVPKVDEVEAVEDDNNFNDNVEEAAVVEKNDDIEAEAPSVVEENTKIIEETTKIVEVTTKVVEESLKVTDENDTAVETAKIVKETVKVAENNTPSAEVTDAPNAIQNGVPKPEVNGVKDKPRLSNEIKMFTNGASKDVIRANDPPEDDLPKNIGVNKFVNFFESLGGKK